MVYWYLAVPKGKVDLTFGSFRSEVEEASPPCAAWREFSQFPEDKLFVSHLLNDKTNLRMGFWKGIKQAFGGKRGEIDDGNNEDKSVRRLDKKYGIVSGGASRDDDAVSAGWAVTKGRRYYNEDATYCQFHPIPGGQPEGSTTQVACMAIFDGHGGPSAAAFVRDNLFKTLLAHPSFHEDLFHAMEQSFVETDVAYLEEDARVKNDDGCTGTAAVIVGRRLVVAHVGDSRAVLGHNGEAIALTDDHKPNRPDERQRIEDVGGTVVHAGTWRVGGVLAVSRSFGNRCMKTYILAKPQIREDALHAGSACLIVASDGLWDVVSNAEAVEFVSKFPEAEAAARGLAALAYDRGSYDNISCCIAKFAFKDEEGNESQANGGEGPVRAVDTAAKVGARVAAEGGIATD